MRLATEAGLGAELALPHQTRATPRRIAVDPTLPASSRDPRAIDRSARSWPASIAFLAPILPPGVLSRAVETAQRQGVTPACVLLAEGAISEEAFYRALARACGAFFVDRQLRLAPGSHHPHAIHAGAAPLATRQGHRLLHAPQGPDLERFLRLAASAASAPLLVTTPTLLMESVRSAARDDELFRISGALGAHNPALSAATPLPPRLVIGLQAFGVALVFALATAPNILWLIASLFVSGMFLSGIVLRGFAAFASCKPERRARPLRDVELPVYTIVAALHREANVAAKFIAALDALDYPRAKLDILLVLEESDAETRAALSALDLPARYRIIVAPEGQPRTKPRALNAALPLARGALLTIYDAEDEPEPDQLRLAAARFALAPKRVACLQGRLVIDNIGDGWLARLFAIEYAGLFDVLNPGLAFLRLPIALGGTSNHFRTAILRRVGGWDAWNVTEDADLGLRLSRFGWRVEALASATHEEAPARLAAWLGQRRRWMKGWMQTLAVHFREPGRFIAELGALRAGAAAALMVSVVLGPLVGPLFLVTTAYDVFSGAFYPETAGQTALAALWALVASSGVVSTLAMLTLGMQRRGLVGLWPWIPLFPVYYALISWVAWRALFEWFSEPFHWEKTAHGLARTSRRNGRRFG